MLTQNRTVCSELYCVMSVFSMHMSNVTVPVQVLLLRSLILNLDTKSMLRIPNTV